MKYVYVVVEGSEGITSMLVCKNLVLAERELFTIRDRLVKEWKKMDKYTQKRIKKFCKEKKKKLWIDNTYRGMIKNLSGNDYQNWDNFPFTCPRITKQRVVEK